MTPGTLTDDPLLDGQADNFLAAVAFGITRPMDIVRGWRGWSFPPGRAWP